MKRDEFTEVRQELASTFPALLTWFGRLPADVQEKQRRIWWATLGEYDVDDVLDAIEDLRKAGGPGETNAERERLAGKIRDHVRKRIVARRSDSATTVDRVAAEKARQGFEPVGPAFEEILRLTSGPDAISVQDACNQLMGPAAEPVTFKCTLCRDLGSVYVWRREAIRAVIEGMFDDHPEFWIIGSLRCSCEAGDGRDGHRYDLNQWCRCDRGDFKAPQNQKDLKAWVAAKMQQAAEARDHRQSEMFH